jgi:hypothetical protein
MENLVEIERKLHKAGFRTARTHPGRKPQLRDIRLWGLVHPGRDIDKIRQAARIVENHGVNVVGYSTGLTSRHDNQIGGTITVSLNT